jgi:hypothetical protein
MPPALPLQFYMKSANDYLTSQVTSQKVTSGLVERNENHQFRSELEMVIMINETLDFPSYLHDRQKYEGTKHG